MISTLKFLSLFIHWTYCLNPYLHLTILFSNSRKNVLYFNHSGLFAITPNSCSRIGPFTWIWSFWNVNFSFSYTLLGLLIIHRYAINLTSYNFLKGITLVNYSYLIPALKFSLIGFLTTIALKIDLFMISILGNSYEVGIYGPAFNLSSYSSSLRNIFAVAFSQLQLNIQFQANLSQLHFICIYEIRINFFIFCLPFIFILVV